MQRATLSTDIARIFRIIEHCNWTFHLIDGTMSVGIIPRPLLFSSPVTSGNSAFVHLELPDGSACPVLLAGGQPTGQNFTCTGAALSIATVSFQDFVVDASGKSPQQLLTATGGKTPYTFFAGGTPATLPPGLEVFNTGIVQISQSGHPPLVYGSFQVTLGAFDNSAPQQQATKTFTINIVCGVTGGCGPSSPNKNLGGPCDPPGRVSCAEPIDIGSGNEFEQVTDYQTATINKLSFTRFYNSQSTSSSSLAP